MLTHLIFSEKLKIEVVTLDTGRLFPRPTRSGRRRKTSTAAASRRSTRKRKRSKALIDDQGINAFYFAPECARPAAACARSSR